MNAQVTLEKITPEDADSMLQDRFPGQRAVRAKHVERLASDMKSGRFHTGPDAIVLIKGKLANGQHRLEAVKQSGKTQLFIVLRSEDNTLYYVMDTGIKRTVGDSLGVGFSKAIPAIARWVICHDNGHVFIGRSGGSVSKSTTHAEIVEWCENNIEQLTDSAKYSAAIYIKSRIMPQSIAGALHFLASRAGKKTEAEAFLNEVYTGDGSEGKASNDLRNRLVINQTTKAKLSAGYLLMLCMKAFGFWTKGRRPGVLKVLDGEGIPSIV